MGYLVVAIIAFIAGIIIACCVSASRMNEEGMRLYNDGYRKGLEDGKKMKTTDLPEVLP